MSKNTTLSQNTSRNSNFHEFDLKEGNILIANNQPYGSPTIDEAQHGVKYPNVNAAINDMPALFTMGVNTVVINTDGISPAGNSQVDEYKFTGVVKAEGKKPGEKTIINCFGFHTEVTVGATAEEATTSIKATLELAKSDGIVFNDVITGATLDIIQVRYNDFQEHYLKPYTDQGVTITPTTVSPAKPGYGIWTRIGTETRTLDGATGSILLHYFKRES